MTNIYDVISQMHVKATAGVEKAVEEDLEREDPPKEEARAILEQIPITTKATSKIPMTNQKTLEGADESTKGNDKKRSSRDKK